MPHITGTFPTVDAKIKNVKTVVKEGTASILYPLLNHDICKSSVVTCLEVCASQSSSSLDRKRRHVESGTVWKIRAPRSSLLAFSGELGHSRERAGSVVAI